MEYILYGVLSLLFVSNILIIYYLYKEKIKKDIFWKQQSVSHGDLEEMYTSIYRNLEMLQAKQNEQSTYSQKIRNTLSYGIVKFGIAKFNFSKDGMGGNLSFSLALLDENNLGVVLTVLHGRDHSRVYGKEVKHDLTGLTEEEKLSIDNAKKYFNY